MTRASKPTCTTALEWLRGNLGRSPKERGVFAALTGTDWRALAAALHILELWTVCATRDVLMAFGLVVEQMQPKTRYFAYHAIAHFAEWDTRARLWLDAGLSFDDLAGAPRCRGDRAAWTLDELRAIDAAEGA